MNILLTFIISVIMTEALTELLVKSEFFKPIRKLFFSIDNRPCKFIHSLLDCGYCTSVWVGFIVSTVLIDINLVNIFVDWFIAGIITHRCSNVWHFIIDRARGLM